MEYDTDVVVDPRSVGATRAISLAPMFQYKEFFVSSRFFMSKVVEPVSV